MNLHRFKFATATVVLGAASFAFSGCGDRPDYDNTSATERASNSAARAVDATADAARNVADNTADATRQVWDSVKDATYNERQAFAGGIKSMSDRISTTVDGWKNRSATIPATSRDAWNASLAKLDAAQDNLSDKLDNLDDASAETWDRAKTEVRQAWDRVQAAYRELESKVTS